MSTQKKKMDTCVKFDIKIVRKQLFPEVILKIKLKKGIYLVSFRVKNKKKGDKRLSIFRFVILLPTWRKIKVCNKENERKKGEEAKQIQLKLQEHSYISNGTLLIYRRSLSKVN